MHVTFNASLNSSILGKDTNDILFYPRPDRTQMEDKGNACWGTFHSKLFKAGFKAGNRIFTWKISILNESWVSEIP